MFVREHNLFVDEFRSRRATTPDDDSGLRDPGKPDSRITYKRRHQRRAVRVARLVVAAEIAKIHTIEWTTQLLYDEPLYLGMNANWSGLFEDRQRPADARGDRRRQLAQIDDPKKATSSYSAFAAGAGIVGLGNQLLSTAFCRPDDRRTAGTSSNPDDVNGGVNHFGSPFNFPEEFISVYRLHPLVPDLIEFRDSARSERRSAPRFR